MTTKEKFEEAKRLYKTANADQKYVLESLFPELKESEDERIRKRIIALVNAHGQGMYKDDMLAWLEKQGGITKLSDEEQNKFAKCVLTSCALSFIDYLDAHKYEDKMCVSNGECEDIENAFHNAMWDRLHRYYCKYIEKQGEQKPDEEYNITGIHSKHAEGKLGEMIKNLKPVNEALEKETPESWKKFLEGEQKPVEKSDVYPPTLNEAIDLYYYSYGNGKGGFDKLSLEKFRDIVKTFVEDYSKLKPAWSEEDEMMLEGTIDKISDLGTGEMCKEWLKSLKDRVQPQPQQEWSEEDEERLKSCLNVLQARGIMGDTETVNTKWLKSLKERYTWRPNDEQMEALEKECIAHSNYELCRLLESLKKLRE